MRAFRTHLSISTMVGTPGTDLNLAKKPRKNKEAADYIGNVERAIARAKICLQAAQQRQKKYADAHRVDLQFNVGDKVFLSSKHVTLKAVGARKMLALWLGPFEILARPKQCELRAENI